MSSKLWSRLGVRWRLLFAFFGISAFAGIAAVAAMHSLLQMGDALDMITRDRVPAVLVSQKLARQTEKIVSAAPTLIRAATTRKHETAYKAISKDLIQLNSILDTLKKQNIDVRHRTRFQRMIHVLTSNLESLQTMVINNVVLVEYNEELLKEARLTRESVLKIITPGFQEIDAKLIELSDALDANASAETEESGMTSGLVEAIASLSPLHDVQVEASNINHMLATVAAAKSFDELDTLVIEIRRSIEALGVSLATLDPVFRDRLIPKLNEFKEFVDGDRSIITVRQRELNQLTLMQSLLDTNVRISGQLSNAVDQLTADVERDIHAANMDAFAVQQTSTRIMVAVVVLSLACSVLIVWLYVGRDLVARLTGLSQSMLAIAEGNLETSVPTGGTDEIAQMAKALSVFRETAIEVRDTNLRQIRTARRRLIDAIESISEGFSLYDADDRLVVCNSTYIQIMYPGIEDAVTPGMSFEAIIRTAVERGLIADAEGRVEEWIAERLDRHRNPGEAHVQRRGNGRWIFISERRTEDGGTVAVYSDITELKQREEELAVKSNALEQLSNQLAKYLAPQVYESIFSGRQEVKLTSRRRKLTVFFSDIVGFTETADRLESEELTQLLNQYLSEMSEIALAHGATIDKYIGDGVMIFFGDPESKGVKEDALSCVQMAIGMRTRMWELQDTWRESGIEHPLQVRMGIHTGFCTVGNFGSESRMDYTIVGGAVNIASRMQTHARAGEILVSYETFAHVKDQILCEERGPVEVKGLVHPVATYQVVDTFDNLKNERRRFRAEHPTLTVDIKLDEMTQDDRTRAEQILRRALKLIS